MRGTWFTVVVLLAFAAGCGGGGDNAEQIPDGFGGSKLLGAPLASVIPCSRGAFVGHSGVDVLAGYGDSVFACADGDVVRAAVHTQYGDVVVIDHGWMADAFTYTLYAHLSAYAPGITAPDATVQAGDWIGNVGNSGEVFSTNGGDGTHLHLEVLRSRTKIVFGETGAVGPAPGEWRVDPMDWVSGLHSSCQGTGLPNDPPPPTGQAPGPFTTTENTSAATGQSYVFDYVMEWNASAGATHYEVFWYRLPLSDTRSFNPSTIDSSGVTPVSVFGPFNAPRILEYTIDWAQEPHRMWARVKAFNAAGETWESGLIVLGYRGP